MSEFMKYVPNEALDEVKKEFRKVELKEPLDNLNRGKSIDYSDTDQPTDKKETEIAEHRHTNWSIDFPFCDDCGRNMYEEFGIYGDKK